MVSDLDAEKAEKVRRVITHSVSKRIAAATVVFSYSTHRLMMQQTAAEIQQAGGEAIVVAGDVTAADFPERTVKATVEKFGGIQIPGQ